MGGTVGAGVDIEPAALGEPALVALEPDLVAQPQVLVADALGTGEQGIHELLGLERVGIAAADHLEPFHGVARRVLDARDVDAAALLVSREHRRDLVGRVADQAELAGELDGVLERELGPEPMAKCAVWAASPMSTTWLLPL